MSIPQENQAQDVRQNDKELNFRKQQQMYERMLAEKDARLAELERITQSRAAPQDDDDSDDEPYVDKRRLEKKLTKFGQVTQSEIEKAMQIAKEKAKEELRNEMWLETNSDFHEIMGHAEKFAEKAPHLAKSILSMPEGFERQKLVYQNIKALGLHQPESPKENIQSKIDANRRGAFYQPTGVGAAPYASQGDFSSSGQQNAYSKMQELKNRLRLG